MPTAVKVWDPVVRLFHWALVVAFTLNAVVFDETMRLHVAVGYAILGLVALRVVWGMIGTRHARFSDFPPDAGAAIAQARELAVGRRVRHLGHSPLGALMIYNLLGTMVLLGVTGYILTLPESTLGHDPEWAEDLHKGLFAWSVTSIAVHVAAVVFETLRTRVTLIRAMITGTKIFPDDR
ncbi:MAG: cytochrome b/b6 domain-containing protein [Rhodobacter sp.]|nr:cytochrome b/b6 domain-containing protein [Paracoccaceae bacterium]MCC0076723.1 cytochrome b/b6 domain-containing protein [Rhodobacter sp.]